MTIAPILRSIEVKATPARAFDLFMNHMAQWWPAGRTVGEFPHVAIVVEPRVGGKWFERDAEGRETQWGHVLAWQPPGRALLAWQLNSKWTFDPDFATELELTFEPAQAGTLVTLRHSALERFGADAASMAEKLGGGWPTHLNQFAEYANAQS